MSDNAKPEMVAAIAAALTVCQQEKERMFPVMREPRSSAPIGPSHIPWSIADKTYSVYAARYGKQQSLERMAERGGFWVSELDELLPTWREECSEIAAVKAERDQAVAALADQRQLVARLRALVKQLRCAHEHRAGGNDYVLCNDCGFHFDYRKLTLEAALKQHVSDELAALVAEQETA